MSSRRPSGLDVEGRGLHGSGDALGPAVARNRWWAFAGAGALLLGLAIGRTGASIGLITAAAFGAAALPLLFIAREKTLVWLLLATVYLGDWLSLDLKILPSQVSWIVELCAIVLLLRLLGKPQTLFARDYVPLWIVLAGVGLSAGLAIFGGAPPMVILAGMRNYLRFPLIAAALLASPGAIGRQSLWRALVIFALVQVPVSIWQLATVGPGDSASGTFGPAGTGIEAIFLCTIVAVLVASRSFQGPSRYAHLLLGLVAFVPIIVGSGVFAYLLLPVGLVLVLLSDERRLLGWAGRIVALSLVVVAITVTGFAVSRGFGGTDPGSIVSTPAAILRYEQGITQSGGQSGAMGRMDKMGIAFGISARRPLESQIFGSGPGMAAPSSLGAAIEGPLRKDPVVRLLDLSLASGLLELGWFGVLTQLCAYGAMALLSILAIRRRSGAGSPLTQVAMVSSVFMIITSVYAGTWTLAGTAALCWLSFAVGSSAREAPVHSLTSGR